MTSMKEQADVIAKSPALMLKRLRQARSVIRNEILRTFGVGTFNFTKRTLIGDNGYTLVWVNDGHTSIGSCYLLKG